MEKRIALGGTKCHHCGHPGISHDWEDIMAMGDLEPVDQVSTGCRVAGEYLAQPKPGVCPCPGFESEFTERGQEKLI